MQPPPPDVKVSCEVELTDATLRVRFEVTNASDEVVHVFDDAGRSGRADLVCDGGDGAAHMLVGVPELPSFPVYWQYHPKTTALAPGAFVRRELVAEIPLRERGPYSSVRYEPEGSVEVSGIKLRVDVLRASRVTTGDDPEPRGERESVFCEASLPGAVDLLRRADGFDRPRW